MSDTRIKFCGFTHGEDMAVALELGIDYVGLVFAPGSKRRLLPEQARGLADMARGRAAVVALLMDNPADEVHAVIAQARPDVLQFHGAEDDAFCAGFGLPYWKAIAMGGTSGDPLAQFARWPHASAFLLDGHGAGEQGGSGKSFDWSLMPQRTDKPLLLAGGLDAGNVAAAIALARPWGVDVSSGIESAPGWKDAAKMRAFVSAVRGVAA